MKLPFFGMVSGIFVTAGMYGLVHYLLLPPEKREELDRETREAAAWFCGDGLNRLKAGAPLEVRAS